MEIYDAANWFVGNWLMWQYKLTLNFAHMNLKLKLCSEKKTQEGMHQRWEEQLLHLRLQIYISNDRGWLTEIYFKPSAVLLLLNAPATRSEVVTGCGKRHATHLSYHAKLTKTKTSEPTKRNDKQPTQFKRFLTTPRTNLLTVKPYIDARQHAQSIIMKLLQQHHFYE